jgi:hypothetical protein
MGPTDALAPAQANPAAAGLIVFNPAASSPLAAPLGSTAPRAGAAESASLAQSPATTIAAIAVGPSDGRSEIATLSAGGDDASGADDNPAGDGDGAPGADVDFAQGSGPTATTPSFQLASQPAGAMAATTNLPPAAAALAQAHGAEVTAQLAAQIASRLGAVRSAFDFSLDPHGLGRVDVSLKIDPQGQLQAVLSFDNPAVAAEARSRAGDLHQALQQAGFDVSQSGLSFTAGGGEGQGAAFQSADRPSWTPAPALADAGPELLAPIIASLAAAHVAGGLDITI